jgi:elongation factor G
MMNGPIIGYPMESIKVRLIDGSFHSVDSDALAFQIAAGIAFREACKKARATLLEPIMRFEIVTPSEYMGDVTGDLNKRRGQVEEVQSRITDQVIHGKVPLSEMFGYVTALRSVSSGRATCMLEFSHFGAIPQEIMNDVLYKIRGYVPSY